MIGHRFRLYLDNGEDVGEATLDWNIGETFKTDGVRYEILDMLQVPEAMGSEYVGIWTVTSVELAEPNYDTLGRTSERRG
jgi:hypothetical protein